MSQKLKLLRFLVDAKYQHCLDIHSLSNLLRSIVKHLFHIQALSDKA